MDEKALNELLECSVCLDRLDHTSKVLPCQHTFCRRCLEEIVSTKRELRCPECRTLVEIRVEDLPTNILLIRLLEGLKNQNNPVLAAHAAGVAKLHLQSRRQDIASPVVQGGSSSAGSSSSHERQGSSSCTNQVSQPSAKALYNYDAKEQGDLGFRKGDSIILRKQIDMNWYQGELNGQTGYFPASYVQVITALPSLIPQCKALYDFDMKDEKEKDCLTFHKDEIVTIIRRVDDNWIEGRKGERIGIFPISFVELNDAAKCLINSKSSAKPSVIVTTANAATPSRPVEIAPPTVSNPTLLSVEMGASKRHSLTSIATQNPPVPAHNQRRSMELVTPILVPCSISSLSSRPVRVTSPSSHSPYPGCVVSASSTGQLSVSKHVSQVTQTPAPVSTTTSSSSCNGSNGGRSATDNVSVISQNMFAAAPGTLISYVAMYNYKPQKEDEVELKKGEYYTVHEKCQDGWFKGTSLKTGHSGVFPGNYVQLVRSSIPMKPASSNVLNIRAKAPSTTTTTSVVIPSAIVTADPTPLHPPASTQKNGAAGKPTAAKSNTSGSSSTESQHQRTGSNPHVPVRQTGPPLMPRMGKAAVVAASQAASSSPNKSSHVTNLSSVGVVKHPHAMPVSLTSQFSAASSKGSNSKGASSHHSEQSGSGSGHSSKKTTHSSGHSGQPVLAQSNPGYSNSALIIKPHAAPAGSNIVISAPPNVVVAGATGGSVSNSSSSPSRDKEKKDKEKKEKLSLVKRLAPGKSKRAKSHDNESAAAGTIATAVHVADVGISHVRSGSYPTEGNAGIAEASQHKKTGSFDSTSTHSASAKSSKPKSVLREKFRCIVPYPPQSEVELELKLGDVVFVHKKREDGWFKGTLQRTGKTGLFPGSFVEKYD